MTPIGINNGNFRAGDYLDWAKQDLSNVPTWEQLIEAKKIAETYGEGWEQDADNIHALIAAAEAGDAEFEDDWCDNGLYDDRPYRPATEPEDLPF